MSQYIEWNNFEEIATWKRKQIFYGGAIILKRSYIMTLFIFMCIITPFTNWLIPFSSKIIKKDIRIRYG